MREAVLIVDPDSRARSVMARELSREFEVREAAGTLDALESILSDGGVEVMVLGLTHPRASLELLDPLRSAAPQTEVLVVIPEGATRLSLESMKRGAFGEISAPFDRRELLEAARSACASTRRRRNIFSRLRDLAENSFAAAAMAETGDPESALCISRGRTAADGDTD